ncbi:MAG: hypothetical protein KAT93_07865 [Desulfuromonadales bacterium]|nr:hypothetical protein [Desulfuromonadales bacterium]
MSLSCPKCGAGKTALYSRIEYVEFGGKLQVIACRICGHWLANRELLVKPLRTLTIRHRGGKKGSRHGTVPCAALGCEKRILSSQQTRTEHTEICPRCHFNLKSWLGSRRNRVVAPVLKVNGTWMRRDHPYQLGAA